MWLWIMGVVALAVVALVVAEIRSRKVLVQKTKHLLESGAEPSAIVEWLDSLSHRRDLAYARIKASQLPNAIEVCRLVQARELADQQRSLEMRGEPKCTLTTFWFSGSDPKQKCPDACANCSIAGHIVFKQRVFLLYTNINNVKVALPICKWCMGHTAFKGGQYDAGGELRFAVTGVHPTFASQFVKLNVDMYGKPIWSIEQ